MAVTQPAAAIQLPPSPIRAVIPPALQSRRPTLILAAPSLSPSPSPSPLTIHLVAASAQPRRRTARPPIPLGKDPENVTQHDPRPCADPYPSIAHRLPRRRPDPHDRLGRGRRGTRPHPDLQSARRPIIRLAPQVMLSRRPPLGRRQAVQLGRHRLDIRRVRRPYIPPVRQVMLSHQRAHRLLQAPPRLGRGRRGTQQARRPTARAHRQRQSPATPLVRPVTLSHQPPRGPRLAAHLGHEHRGPQPAPRLRPVTHPAQLVMLSRNHHAFYHQLVVLSNLDHEHFLLERLRAQVCGPDRQLRQLVWRVLR